MVSQLWPDSKAEQKRAPKTPRYYKCRKPKRSKTMSKKDFDSTERLSPAEHRIYEYLKASSIGGLYCGSQLKVAKSLALHPQTAKKGFKRLCEKRFLAKACNNVYMLNPERFFTGEEEVYAKAFHDFYELVSEARRADTARLRNAG